MIPISTSTIVATLIKTLINSTITRGRLAVLLRHVYTSTIFTTMINSMIDKGRVAGIKIYISKSSITRIHFKTFIIINTIFFTMARGRMAGLSISISKTSITTNIEITCLSILTCTIVYFPLIMLIPISCCHQWHQGINCIRT